MKGYKLLATSPTFEGITKLVSEFCCKPITLKIEKISEGEWSITTGRGLLAEMRIVEHLNHYRFVQLKKRVL